MFSHRVPPLQPNRWWESREKVQVVCDLTVSNPTLVGLPYPQDLLLPLAHPRGLIYEPQPLGLWEARQAVARLYGRRGAEVDPSAVVITASTSESYSLLAKLLCQPGEGFLVPQPSYPLFEHLLRLEGCQAFPYPLPEESGFHLEASALPCLAQAKAVVVVQPNNPTGTVIPPGQGEALVARCAAQGQALIADEVFWEYPLSPFPRQSLVGNGGCLTFTLGGLSKLVGLPQLKLGWMVVSGPQDLVEQAMTRLEFLADTYLSVSTPLQQALGEILARAWPVHQAIAQRIRENLQLLRRLVASYPFLQLLPPEGGWSAVLRFPRLCSEEELVLELLEGEGVACYPGYFFDFPGEGYVVVSLLVRPETLTQGIGHLAEKLVSKGAGPKGGLSP